MTKSDSSQREWVSFKNWNEGKSVIAENDSIIWVGTSVGLIRWNIVQRTFQTYDERNGLLYPKVNALAFDQSGRLWIATSQGIVIYSQGQFSFIDHTNSNLPDATVRNIVINNSGKIVVSCGWFVRNDVWEQGAICILKDTTWDIYTIPNIYSAFGPPGAMTFYHDTLWVSWHTLYVLANDQLVPFPNWPYYAIGSIIVDYQDSLWVETSHETVKWMGNRWQTVVDRDREGIGSLWLGIWNDPRGGLWLSDGWGAPYRLDINERRNGQWGIGSVSGIPGDFNSCYARSATQQFFVGNWGLARFNGSTWTRYTIPQTLLSNEIYGLGCAPSGEIYFTSPTALQRTDGIKWESIGGPGWIDPPIRFRPDGSLWLGGIPTDPPIYVTGLEFDGYGSYWGAYGSVMSFSSSGLKSWMPSDMGISSTAQFMDITVDKSENIWTAGWYYPAAMFDRTNWHPFPRTDTALVNFDYDRVFADSKGRVWFATNQWFPNYGFSMYDGRKWTTFYSPESYFVSAVYQFAEDPFGDVWMATGSGVLRFDGKTFELFDSRNSPIKTAVGAIAVDLRGNVWAGTNAGLYVYNPRAPVELGPYSNSSPVDTLIVAETGDIAKVSFRPVVDSPVPVRFQLQRGRGIHKFWTVAEVSYATSIPPRIEIIDSSTIIGKYYYRIREVSEQGKTRVSPATQFTGKMTGVTLLNFESRLAGNRMLLRWNSRDEQFVLRYEVSRSDSANHQFTLVKSIDADPLQNDVRRYEIEVDTLSQSPRQRRYTLRVVYSDSTRSELRSMDFTPQLPLTFRVSQNYPNPFNSSTNLDVEMPTPGLVTVRLYDLLGREVPIHHAQELDQGYQKLQINLNSLSSGMYFYAVDFLGQRTVGKLLLLK